jgi:hypothetical protein
MKDGKFDLEGELRKGRSQPRDEFVTSLAGDVRKRVRRSRAGLMVALCGLMVVAVTSFGGIGYAATSKQHKATSAASAQYTSFTPKHTQAKPTKSAAGVATAPPAKASSQLPFTGLALWIPLAFGLVLIGSGVVLTTRARRHGSEAR